MTLLNQIKAKSGPFATFFYTTPAALSSPFRPFFRPGGARHNSPAFPLTPRLRGVSRKKGFPKSVPHPRPGSRDKVFYTPANRDGIICKSLQKDGLIPFIRARGERAGERRAI